MVWNPPCLCWSSTVGSKRRAAHSLSTGMGYVGAAEVSALEHVLEGQKTIRRDKGLFLEETWRLHPSILCVHF